MSRFDRLLVRRGGGPGPSSTAAPELAGGQAEQADKSLGSLVARYNEYGSKLRNSLSMRELAEDLMQIAEFAEQSVMAEADDWFDGHTVKRNMKEMKSYVSEFAKIANEYDMIGSRATALYDDMGRVLERYFEVADDVQPSSGYDTDNDGEDDIIATNTQKDPVQPSVSSRMQQETAEDVVPCIHGGDCNCGMTKNEDLIERLMTLARHKLTGEQLSRFDTLQKETKIRAAWRIVQ